MLVAGNGQKVPNDWITEQGRKVLTQQRREWRQLFELVNELPGLTNA
jgi:DNA-binding PadR family transcriptional regulator